MDTPACERGAAESGDVVCVRLHNIMTALPFLAASAFDARESLGDSHDGMRPRRWCILLCIELMCQLRSVNSSVGSDVAYW